MSASAGTNDSNSISSPTEKTTDTEAPQRKASTSRRGGSGSQRSSHTKVNTTTTSAAVDSTIPIVAPTGLSAVKSSTISPATVPSAMIRPSGAPTLRMRRGSGGTKAWGCWGGCSGAGYCTKEGEAAAIVRCSSAGRASGELTDVDPQDDTDRL